MPRRQSRRPPSKSIDLNQANEPEFGLELVTESVTVPRAVLVYLRSMGSAGNLSDGVRRVCADSVAISRYVCDPAAGLHIQEDDVQSAVRRAALETTSRCALSERH